MRPVSSSAVAADGCVVAPAPAVSTAAVSAWLLSDDAAAAAAMPAGDGNGRASARHRRRANEHNSIASLPILGLKGNVRRPTAVPAVVNRPEIGATSSPRRRLRPADKNARGGSVG